MPEPADNPVNEEAFSITAKLQQLLTRQESILLMYLQILEIETTALVNRTAEKLVVYIRKKTHLEKELKAIQKVINAYEALFKSKYCTKEFFAYDNSSNSVKSLKIKIEKLKDEIIAGIEENRKILNGQLALLKAEMRKLAVPDPYKAALKLSATPAFIDITG